jgi:lipopolysaccharide/colanic/teichoic acid biosynthesis glycosyltransferase
VYSVRPGITGPAAIAFLAEDEYLASVPNPVDVYCRVLLPEKLRLELDYVERWTFATDLKLIAQTLLRVFSIQARRRSLRMIEQIAAAAAD